MVYFIHGDDITNSRTYVLNLLSGKEYLIIDKKSDENTLLNAFATDGLFSVSKTIFIDELSSLKGNLNKRCLEYVMQSESDSAIKVYVWDSKTIDKRILSKFKKAKVELYALPKHFFVFLDSFAPRNGAKLHDLLFKLYPQFSPEQILYALINRMRLLVYMTKPGPEPYDELVSLAPWQRSKIQAQARLWTKNDIIAFYKKLFEIEVALKTSALPMPLINHLDFLIVSKLQ